MTNEEIIRAGYATFNRGDRGDVPSFFSEDAVIDTSVAFIGPIDYRGREGAKQFIDSITDMFETYEAEPVEVVAAGDRVLCVVDLCGRLRATGREVQDREIQLWRLNGGAIVELTVYRDRADADRAMGILEESS
ncbi:MAG: nuclear transport factor 2 family protein [Thermoleophilaceae bacterium]